MGANMNRKKSLFCILLIVTTSLAYLFAGGEWEDVLLAQPTNVINNQSILIEMSQAKSIDFNSAFGSVTYTEPYQSSYEAQGDLVLFTLIDTLNSSNNGDVSLTITSDDATGFFFVKDGNETNTVQYTMDVCIVEFEINKSLFSVSYKKSSNSGKMQLNTDKTVGDNAKTKFANKGNNGYTLSIPKTSYTTFWFSGAYPQFLRYYYVCINILGGQNLEEGTYTSSFYIESSGNNIPRTKYTIKGYVGEKPLVESTVCSFYIDPAADSYYTDLVVKTTDQTSPAKAIASLKLYNTRRKGYSSNNEPSADNLKKRFTIYVSPTSVYTANGDYVFKKTGTENQADSFANRIYYEIDTTNTTGLAKLSNTNNTYYFYPEYTNQLISNVSGTKTYQEFWKLENKLIYIKVSNVSKEDDENLHSVGTYTSTIYFTIVPNESL